MSNRDLFKSDLMRGEIESIGQVLFCQDGNREAFMEIISRLDLKEPVVIKPNWSNSEVYTEAEVLDWILSALNCERIVVESYAHYRSPIYRDHKGAFDEDFEKKLAAQKRKDLQENDRWFLEISRIGDVLKKHDVEYLNLSKEFWSKQVCDPDQIRRIVESRFEPLVNEIMYSMVPTRIFEMRGGTLLSLAKPKLSDQAIGVTLSIKNLFGVIPTPYRGKFHGVNDVKLNDSIMDINKIYHSLFDVRGVVEAVFSTSVSMNFLAKSRVIQDQGLIWGSNDIFELDAVITTQLGLDAQRIGHLDLAAHTFGQWSQQTIDLAKRNPIELQ